MKNVTIGTSEVDKLIYEEQLKNEMLTDEERAEKLKKLNEQLEQLKNK